MTETCITYLSRVFAVAAFERLGLRAAGTHGDADDRSRAVLEMATTVAACGRAKAQRGLACSRIVLAEHWGS
jgi:hypothetical protein